MSKSLVRDKSSDAHELKGEIAMIRLVTLLKRKPGMTHDEFLNYWFNTHGPLIANCSAAKYVRRYEQHPVSWPAAGQREPDFDGVTIQFFDSVGDFMQHMTEPDFPQVMEDTEKFLDSANLHWVLTEEPNVVIGSE